MKCPACGTENASDAKFCGACNYTFVSKKWNVWLLLPIIAVSTVFVVLLILVLLPSLGSTEKAESPEFALEQMNETIDKAAFVSLPVHAAIYFEEHGNSYDGVCDVLKGKLLLSAKFSFFDCNDTPTEYAAALTTVIVDDFCIDSAGYNREFEAQELRGRASCEVVTTPIADAEVDPTLRDIIDSTKTILPRPSGENMEWASVYIRPGNVVSFRYNFLQSNLADIAWVGWVSQDTPRALAYYCTDPTTAFLREGKFPLEWDYYSRDDQFVARIRVDASDCSQ